MSGCVRGEPPQAMSYDQAGEPPLHAKQTIVYKIYVWPRYIQLRMLDA